MSTIRKEHDILSYYIIALRVPFLNKSYRCFNFRSFLKNIFHCTNIGYITVGTLNPYAITHHLYRIQIRLKWNYTIHLFYAVIISIFIVIFNRSTTVKTSFSRSQVSVVSWKKLYHWIKKSPVTIKHLQRSFICLNVFDLYVPRPCVETLSTRITRLRATRKKKKINKKL